MIKIIEKLMNFGFDFEYENSGSNGEKITCYALGLEVSNQQGKIYYSCSSIPETYTESPDNYSLIAKAVEQECINETSSF